MTRCVNKTIHSFCSPSFSQYIFIHSLSSILPLIGWSECNDTLFHKRNKGGLQTSSCFVPGRFNATPKLITLMECLQQTGKMNRFPGKLWLCVCDAYLDSGCLEGMLLLTDWTCVETWYQSEESGREEDEEACLPSRWSNAINVFTMSLKSTVSPKWIF